MNYPTMEEVEKADRIQLARWVRFLDSPGIKAAGRPEFELMLKQEGMILDRILERFNESGGWSPSISKTIGLGI